MKIAIIGRYGEGEIIPGPERVARELYYHLKKKNSEVVFIEYFFSGYSNHSFLKKIFGSEKKDEIFQLGIIPLIITLLKKRFDVIHLINSQRFTLIIFFLKPFLKGKFISSLHGLSKDEINFAKVKRSFLDLWVEKMSVGNSDILIFPSKLLSNLFKRNYNFSENKCRIIPNGVNKIFIEDKIKFSNLNKYNFVYYNSFGKGLKELLLLLSGLKEIQLNLYVIGKGERIENQNENINIEFVRLMNQNNFKMFLSDKHFIIKSSAFDSFSIITAECMSMGMIPIVSENTGIKELIEDKCDGFIYNSFEKDNLPLLLKDIYDGAYNLNKISSNASKIYEKLNWEKVSEEYISIYRELVD